MNKVLPHQLSRRERQIMDIIYARGEATVAEVLEAMSDPPSYSSVRALMRILEEKGQLRHTEAGAKYVYKPTESWTAVAKSAIENVVHTFFGGSVESAVATLLANQQMRPTDEELSRLEGLIQQAKSKEQNVPEEGTNE
ncbi:MAG: BlaI/MecI/CopY family transcriptional regulator [Capsulimonas sp.]|uniref:BlaI/MecI/CopY family transcriptional regulator n=1 Tax=Capsulimonas sp. TaxID=2494211 RepID=UPI003263B6DB